MSSYANLILIALRYVLVDRLLVGMKVIARLSLFCLNSL